MKKLFAIIILPIILCFWNNVYCQVKPTLIDSAKNIVIQNSWIKVEVAKKTGEISSFVFLTQILPRIYLPNRLDSLSEIKEIIPNINNQKEKLTLFTQQVIWIQ